MFFAAFTDWVWEPSDDFLKWFAIIGGIIAFAVLIALICIAGFSKKKTFLSTRETTLVAICTALSFALSYTGRVTAWLWPQGGAITLASILPIAVYSYYFGFKKGLLAGLIYGVLQMIQDPFFVHPMQIIFDYPLAFMSLSLPGLFKPLDKKMKKDFGLWLYIGIAIAGMGRYFFHTVSGALFFAAVYAPELPAWQYSLGYNLYVLFDAVIAVVAAVPLMLNKGFRRMLEDFSINAKKQFFTRDTEKGVFEEGQK